MKINEFIEEFAALLEVDSSQLHTESELRTFEMWDSVTILSAMVLIDDKVGITVRPEVISEAVTLGDILKAVYPEFSAVSR